MKRKTDLSKSNRYAFIALVFIVAMTIVLIWDHKAGAAVIGDPPVDARLAAAGTIK